MKTLAILFTLVTAPLATAAPITFIHTGIGSGTLGDASFQDAAFTVTGLADTINRIDCGPSVVSDCFSITHETSTISIEGLGTFLFTSSLRTFVDNSSRTVGFARSGDSDFDLFEGPNSDEFATWTMLSSIGPVEELGRLSQWTENGARPAVTTEAGVLQFDNESNVTATFQSIVGPGEPLGDTDADGDVDLDDLNNVRNSFGESTGLGDTYPFDGDVDLDDLNAVRNNFGGSIASTVPEPSSLALIACAAGALAAVRRRSRIGQP
jgi:hypothetical protein